MPSTHNGPRPSGAENVREPPLLLVVVQLSALALHVPLATLAGPKRALAGVGSALTVGLVVAILSFLVYLLLKAWSGSGWTSLGWVSVALLLFWHWNGLGAIGAIPHWVSSGVLAIACIAAVGRFAEARLFRMAAIVASATLAGTLALITVHGHLTTPPPAVSIINAPPASALTRTPDIVLIVLDGYARADVLDSLYEFDNSAFLSDLSDAGFDVSESSNANYSWTHFSLASMLEMSYLIDESESVSNSDLLALKTAISGANGVVEILKQNGYTYVHGDTDHWLNTCGPEVDHCLPGPPVDLTADALLAGTPVGSLFYPAAGDPTTALNLARLDQLRHWPDLRDDYGAGPTFTFLHLVLPHPPLFLDEACQPRLEPQLDGRYMTNGEFPHEVLTNRRAAYVDQIECANLAIRDFNTKVDRDTVVVITSDHGPDSLEPITSRASTIEQRWERFGNLSAIRLPPGCEPVPADHQLVNTFRLVLGCLSGTQMELLEKKYYLAGYGGEVEQLKDPDSNAESLMTYSKEDA